MMRSISSGLSLRWPTSRCWSQENSYGGIGSPQVWHRYGWLNGLGLPMCPPNDMGLTLNPDLVPPRRPLSVGGVRCRVPR